MQSNFDDRKLTTNCQRPLVKWVESPRYYSSMWVHIYCNTSPVEDGVFHARARSFCPNIHVNETRTNISQAAYFMNYMIVQINFRCQQ